MNWVFILYLFSPVEMVNHVDMIQLRKSLCADLINQVKYALDLFTITYYYKYKYMNNSFEPELSLVWHLGMVIYIIAWAQMMQQRPTLVQSFPGLPVSLQQAAGLPPGLQGQLQGQLQGRTP